MMAPTRLQLSLGHIRDFAKLKLEPAMQFLSEHPVLTSGGEGKKNFITIGYNAL